MNIQLPQAVNIEDVEQYIIDYENQLNEDVEDWLKENHSSKTVVCN